MTWDIAINKTQSPLRYFSVNPGSKADREYRGAKRGVDIFCTRLSMTVSPLDRDPQDTGY